MAQGHPKSRGVDGMVAIADAEADWALPILRCKRHYTGITALLLLFSETRLYVGKQTEPGEEL